MSEYSHAIPVASAASRANATDCSVTRLGSALLPNFGTIVFVVALFEVLIVSQTMHVLFRDSDTGWHIRNGEAILATGSVPYVDSFSYTRAGSPWIAWEWGSDAALAEAHRIAGLTGVAVFASVIIALAIWAAARLSLFLGGNFLLTAVSTLVLLNTTSIHWLARPHLLSWLLAIAALAVAEHERRSPTRWLYAVPFLACLWANLHGSFPLAPGILFVYAIGGWLANDNRRSSFRFAATSLASLLATFVNPYGWRLHEYFLGYLGNTYLMDHIAEYRSFSFHMPGAIYVELFLLIAVLGTLALLKQKAYGPALIAMGFLHLSLYSARHLPMAAVLLLPLSISALTREVRQWPRWAPFISYSERLQAIDAKVWGVVPAVVCVIAMLFGINAMANRGFVGFDASVFPVRAAEFLEKQPTDARIFSQDQWGGYLIYRFSGSRKVFLDGRGDFYGQQMLEAYGQVMEVGPDWHEVLKEYNVHFVLIPPDHALATVLKLSPAWKQVYGDSVAAVFERAGRSPAS